MITFRLLLTEIWNFFHLYMSTWLRSLSATAIADWLRFSSQIRHHNMSRKSEVVWQGLIFFSNLLFKFLFIWKLYTNYANTSCMKFTSGKKIQWAKICYLFVFVPLTAFTFVFLIGRVKLLIHICCYMCLFKTHEAYGTMKRNESEKFGKFKISLRSKKCAMMTAYNVSQHTIV